MKAFALGTFVKVHVSAPDAVFVKKLPAEQSMALAETATIPCDTCVSVPPVSGRYVDDADDDVR